MELVQEEVMVSVKQKLGESYKVFWRRHTFFKRHCGMRMAVLEIRVSGREEEGRSTVFACRKSGCGFTEPDVTCFD